MEKTMNEKIDNAKNITPKAGFFSKKKMFAVVMCLAVFGAFAMFPNLWSSIVNNTPLGLVINDSYTVSLTNTEAKLTKAYIVAGNPVIKITSDQVTTKLTLINDGQAKIAATINGKDNSYNVFKLNGYVNVSPVFDANTSQYYNLRGDGWTGFMDVKVIEDGKIEIPNMSMTIKTNYGS